MVSLDRFDTFKAVVEAGSLTAALIYWGKPVRWSASISSV